MTQEQKTSYVLAQVTDARQHFTFEEYAAMASGIWTALTAATAAAHEGDPPYANPVP